MAGKHYKVFKRKGSSVWQVRVYTPVDVQKLGAAREVVKSTGETDHARANVRAAELFEEHRAYWEELRGKPVVKNEASQKVTDAQLLALGLEVFEASRRVIVDKRGAAYAGNPSTYTDYRRAIGEQQIGWSREADGGDLQRWEGTAAAVLERKGFPADDSTLPKFTKIVAEATIAARDVEFRREGGERSAEPSSPMLEHARRIQEAGDSGGVDLPFSELVQAYMRMWKAGRGADKETNTEQQKEATYRLFGEFWCDKPIRRVKIKDVAEFRDTLKLLDPNWARAPIARQTHWDDLVIRYGNHSKGLSDSTMNRHMRALQSLWHWADQRGHCEGRHNPFSGFHVKLKLGENTHSYRAWEVDELQRLLHPGPKRSDLRDVMIVGMFTGMRLEEIASLTWGRVRTEGIGDHAITYFDINDAKTPAGVRQVPVHPALDWLLKRERGNASERLWPKFNLEGVGGKAGADASKMFSDFKIGCGFKSQQKTFHSFRKNVTRIMERAGVLENEWAQVFGHERGFTYKVYNPDGITLARKAEIIGLIGYPGLKVPHPVPTS